MIVPIRCITCNKVVADKWLNYLEFLSRGLSEKESLDRVNLERFCCRRMLLSHVDLIDNIVKYS